MACCIVSLRLHACLAAEGQATHKHTSPSFRPSAPTQHDAFPDLQVACLYLTASSSFPPFPLFLRFEAWIHLGSSRTAMIGGEGCRGPQGAGGRPRQRHRAGWIRAGWISVRRTTLRPQSWRFCNLKTSGCAPAPQRLIAARDQSTGMSDMPYASAWKHCLMMPALMQVIHSTNKLTLQQHPVNACIAHVSSRPPP